MLRFHFDWADKYPRGDKESATLGRLTVTLKNSIVWDGIEWTWCDLLNFLVTNWNKLENEGLLPPDASEAQKYDFDVSHDLAYVPRGRSPLPSIIFARRGLLMQVSTGSLSYNLDTPTIVRDLKSLGNAIAQRLLKLSDPEAKNLVNQWSTISDLNLNQNHQNQNHNARNFWDAANKPSQNRAFPLRRRLRRGNV